MKNRNFQTQEDPFSRDAQGINKSYHDVLLLMKLSQTKPQVKNMNIIFYDLYYTVIKNIDESKVVKDKNELIENDHVNFNDIVPNHYVGIKPRETILK